MGWLVSKAFAFVAVAAALAPVSASGWSDAVLPARIVGSGSAPLPGLDGLELESRMREAKRWVDDYTAWTRWNDEWRNRREPGWFGAKERRQRPEPPPWLAADCLELVSADGALATACELLKNAQDDIVTAELRGHATVQTTQEEKPTKTQWWEHVHFDALWMMPQLHTSVFGVVGMHATMEVAGRFQVFVAPGAIVLNLPTPRGTREWKPATDWGIAYRVADFTFPGTGRRASLHLNLAKAWVFGGPANSIRTGLDLAGFSLSFKKDPRDRTP
jgi:hypothetical protein